MAIASLDLNQRLTALEQNRVDDTLIAGQNEGFLLETLRDVQSDVHALHNRVQTVHGNVKDLVQTVNAEADKADQRSWYTVQAHKTMSELVSMVESVAQRQLTAEQLLDAIRVYAAERQARDGQTSEPDESEDGCRV